MITKEIANKLVEGWVESWNCHNIDGIMSHYANDIFIVSPIAGKLLGNSEVRGIDSVRSYFLKGLQAYPDLKFKILDVLYGEQSIILYYVNQDGVKVGEFMQIDSEGKIYIMYAHYS